MNQTRILLFVSLLGFLCLTADGSLNHEKGLLLPVSSDRSNENRLEDVLYECNFDEKDCQIKFDQTNPSKFTINKTLKTSNYTFTDVTSITSPTDSGSPCSIPFIFLTIGVFYHCTEDGFCGTANGKGKCQLGNFLGGMFDTREQSNSMELPVKSQQFGKGIYELSFYAFMDCEDSADCWPNNDVIQINIYSNVPLSNLLIKKTRELRPSDFQVEKKWQKFTIDLRELNDVDHIEVVIIKDPNSSLTSKSYYGIDNLKIYLVNRLETLFSCNFDSSDCKMAANADVSKSIRSELNTNSYTFTDVTSITQKTENGQTCQIPYFENEQYYYHCNKNMCLTANGPAKCAQGRFMGEVYKTFNGLEDIEYRFNLSVNTQRGIHRISLKSFYYCEETQEACNSIPSSVTFYIKNEHNIVISPLFKIKSSKAWVPFYADFAARINNDILCVRVVGPKNSSIYYGIDDLELAFISNNISSTTTTATTTQPNAGSISRSLSAMLISLISMAFLVM